MTIDINNMPENAAQLRGNEDYSLVALRAFREVAKHKSFTLAARHLNVTQSAVSHHVRLLESQYKVVLFDREGRRIDLSAEGRVLYDVLESSFTAIEKAVVNLREGNAKKHLVLGVLASFASKWLVPRIGSFYKNNESIELTIRSVNHTIDVSREHFDLAVITAPEPPLLEEVMSEKLWQEQLFVVCSPSYYNLHKDHFNSLADLSLHVFLHDETEISAERGFDWATWMRHFDVMTILNKVTSHYFSQSDLALQAAIAGNGLALTRTSIAATDMSHGRLINPFPAEVINTKASCFLCGLKGAWNTGATKQLRDWLLEEAKAVTPIQK